MSSSLPKRILLKLSGEALMGDGVHGIDPDVVQRICTEVFEVSQKGIEIAIVVGGGNIFRGSGLASGGFDRVSADHMGMLATVMNALVLQNGLEALGAQARVMSALKINEVCEDYIQRRAVRHLEKGRIVIFASGTGNPFFTTDSAASLRGIEIGADIVLKATKVDGVYSADPVKDNNAVFYPHLTYDEVIEQKLNVMDTTAVVLCRDHNMPLRIFNLNTPGALVRAVTDRDEGTLVE